ncbi:hypothetical protein VNO78_04341 [Psophocarpus tetragonolobus]|uniref:Hydrophobic seed protein domain-containing protein n=1 Tax=Psophocarpus tetragonolobus TaxID=3891 RepID=A0AAN9T5P7_PSOTE
MGSKSVAFLLFLDLLFFSMATSNPLVPNFQPKCPDLRICANILLPPFIPDSNCCPLIEGLIDLQASVCLCSVLKLNIGGIITISLDILLNLQLNNCGRHKPPTYTCQ